MKNKIKKFHSYQCDCGRDIQKIKFIVTSQTPCTRCLMKLNNSAREFSGVLSRLSLSIFVSEPDFQVNSCQDHRLKT
jgi:hypothetical protein